MISDADRWLDIELRHLAALDAIASEGSFRRAAERLGYTQSAVSQQIAVLERIVGAQLIHRPGGPRPVSLTDAGSMLLAHGQAVLSRMRAAQGDLASLATGMGGTLRIGTYQSTGRCILPPLLREFSRVWPQVDVRLREEPIDDLLLPSIEQGELDLAFGTYPLPDGPFSSVEILVDPYVLMVPSDSSLARRGGAGAVDLDGTPLIGYRTCKTVQVAEAALRESGVEPRVVFRSDDNGTVQAMVAAGMGLALVPRLSVDPGDPAVTTVELDLTIPPRHLALVWHRDRYVSPVMQAFIDMARQVCRAYEAGLAGSATTSTATLVSADV